MTTFDHLVVVRIGELAHRASPWHRRLWGLGTAAAVRELAETAQLFVDTGHGSSSFAELAKQVGAAVQRDPAMPAVLKGELLHEIHLKAPPDARRVAVLQQIAQELSGPAYLRLLAGMPAAQRTEEELWARLIAGHLLDEGWSEDAVLQISDRFRHHESDSLQLLLEHVASEPIRRFTVVVAAARVPLELQHPDWWVDRAELGDIVGLPPMEGLTGAFRREVSAHDVNAAAVMVGAELELAVARYQASRRGRRQITLSDVAMVQKSPASRWVEVQVQPPSRRIEVKELVRSDPTGRLFDGLADRALDNAVILAETAETSNGPQVPALLWAALESVFVTSPGSPHVCDRLADLLVASLVRAELTVLAHQLVAESHALSESIQNRSRNADKSAVLETAIRSGDLVELQQPRHVLALRRITSLVSDEHAVRRLRSYLAGAVARIQRERNRSMHGGTLSRSGGPAVLRSGPSLVSAILDRVVWASTQDPPLSAEALAARATVRGRGAVEGADGLLATILEPDQPS